MKKVATYLLHGSLGSGKTTILKRLLSDARFQKSIVIENEFAHVNLDKDLLAQTNEEIRILDVSGGCVCCTSSQNLLDALQEVRQERDIDHLFIETSGVSSSVQLVRQLMLSHDFDEHFTLVKNIFVIDALEETRQRLEGQKMLDLLMADLVILHKTDLAPEEKTESLRVALRRLPDLRFVEAAFGGIAAEDVFSSAPSRSALALLEHIDMLAAAIDHGAATQYQVMYPKQAITPEEMAEVLKAAARLGADIVRVKGYFKDAHGRRHLINGTKHHMTITEAPSAPAEDAIVCIGHGVTKESLRPVIERLC